MKKITKILENVISTLITITIYTSGNIVLGIIGIPFLLITCSKIYNLMIQNIVKDSMFSVSEDGHINQNALAQPLKMLKIIKVKDKKEIFIEEAKKMFEQLPRTNKKSEVIQYTTVSHILTYKLLIELEKEGYITDLIKTPYKRRKLLFEKILIGNKQKINKKYKMYNISFKLTEKKLTDKRIPKKEEIMENYVNFKNTDEKSISDNIKELKELKEQLEDNNENIENKRRVK